MKNKKEILSDPIYVLDLETSGFNNIGNDVILEVSIFEISKSLEIKEKYTTSIKYPEFESEKFINRINNSWWMRQTGYDYERDFRNEPTFVEVWNEMRNILENKYVVSWNMAFDFGKFLDKIDMGIIGRFNLPKISYRKLPCPMKVATKYVGVWDKYGRVKWPSLSEAAMFYGVSFEMGAATYHQAKIDAEIASIILVEMIKKGNYDLSKVSTFDKIIIKNKRGK